MKNRLFFKIFASYLVLILLVMAVMDFLHTPQIRETLTGNFADKMIGHGKIITLLPDKDIRHRISELAEFSDSRVTLIDHSGRVTADSDADETTMDNHLNRSELQEARLKGQGSAVRYSRTLRENMLYVAIPIKTNDQIHGYIRLARPLSEVRESIERAYHYLYLTLLIIAVPALLLAFFFSRKFTSPIRRMAEFSKKIRGGEAPGSLVMSSQDEVGQLARDMNFILEEQREKTRLATEEKSKLEAAFSGMVEGVLVLDGENKILACNRTLRHMLGRRNEDILGRTPLEIFHSAPLQDALSRFRKTGGPVREDISLGDDQSIVVNVNIAAIHGLHPDERKAIIVFHDVTRLKNLERMRSDFVSNVTHELKTPLTAIIGYTDTLQEGAINDKTLSHKFLGIIHDHAHRLDRLVNDLLTLSDLEQGETTIALKALALGPIVQEILPLVAAKAEDKGLRIETTIPQDLPMILGDYDKVTQILLNILDNAVKFTASGSITIRALPFGDDAVSIEIADTGTGIPRSEIPRLGERFYRVDRTRSRELGGTGLGLSIVKHLMKAHHGEMHIDSTPGQGTTVALRFRACP